jgi:hypothetical protein
MTTAIEIGPLSTSEIADLKRLTTDEVYRDVRFALFNASRVELNHRDVARLLSEWTGCSARIAKKVVHDAYMSDFSV